MHKEAVQHYHDLLNDAALATASVATLDAGLESSKLIFGGRRLSPYLRPHFVSSSDWRQITRICETVFSALNKVRDAAIADESILAELGLTDIERELVRIDPGYSHVSANCRLDSFLTEDAYSYVELNGESPAGVASHDPHCTGDQYARTAATSATVLPAELVAANDEQRRSDCKQQRCEKQQWPAGQSRSGGGQFRLRGGWSWRGGC